MARHHPRLLVGRDPDAAHRAAAEPARPLEPDLSRPGALAVPLDAPAGEPAAAARREPREPPGAEIGSAPRLGLQRLFLALRLSRRTPAAVRPHGEARHLH